MLVFKLDRVHKYQDKLDQLLTKLPEHERGIKDVTANLDILKRKYENFEKNLFDKKFGETKYVIKDTAQLIEKIQT